MRCLHIQVQPDRSPGVDMGQITQEFDVIAAIQGLVDHHSFSSGQDHGSYFNFAFETARASQLWRVIQTRIYENTAFGCHVKRASLAVCSDEDGSWEDYLLLFHFDPEEKLDSASALDRDD